MRGTIISDGSEIRGVDEGMLVTFLLLMLEVPGRPGAVLPREALEIVGVVAEVGVGAGVETEEKRKEGWPNGKHQCQRRKRRRR